MDVQQVYFHGQKVGGRTPGKSSFPRGQNCAHKANCVSSTINCTIPTVGESFQPTLASRNIVDIEADSTKNTLAQKYTIDKKFTIFLRFS